MKRIILPLLLTFIIAGELEVDGNLKVSGNIDAQNQAIKNVGIPQDLTDAINGNVLQDALRDDGVYEYTFLYVKTYVSSYVSGESGFIRLHEMSSGVYTNPINQLHSEITNLFNDDWKIDSINGIGESASIWIFKRAIDE